MAIRLPKMTPVKSSMVVALGGTAFWEGHRAGSEGDWNSYFDLWVQFNTGKVYKYLNVPQTHWDNLLHNTTSVGHYLSTHIKGVYTFVLMGDINDVDPVPAEPETILDACKLLPLSEPEAEGEATVSVPAVQEAARILDLLAKDAGSRGIARSFNAGRNIAYLAAAALVRDLIK